MTRFLFLFFATISFTFASPSRYGTIGTQVYKIDGTGNLEWTRDFNGKIIPTNPDSNALFGVAFDGNYLYVNIVQGDVISMYRDPSIVIMDTTGNVIHVVKNFKPSGGFLGCGCIPSVTGGAWMIYMNKFTMSNSVTFLKVNSAGQINSNNVSGDAQFEDQNYLWDRCILPDSTYLLLTSSFSQLIPTQTNVGLVKFNESGNIVWQKYYRDSGSIFSNSNPQKIAVDGSGNIYVFGKFDRYNGPRGTFGLKMNSAGDILIQKAWLDSTNRYFDEVTISNDSVLLKFNTGLGASAVPGFTQMDTALNIISCYDPPFTPAFYAQQYSPMGNVTLATAAFGAFLPSIVGSILLTQTIYQDYCFMLNTESLLQKNIEVWVQNNQGRLKIFTNESENPFQVTLINLEGKIIFENKFFVNGQELNASSLSPAIYILKIKSEGKSFVKRVLIE